MANFCTNCGAKLQPGMAFCSSCGAPANDGVPEAGNYGNMQQPGGNYGSMQQPAGNYGNMQQPAGDYGYASPQQYMRPASSFTGNAPSGRRVPAPGFSRRVNDPEIVAAVNRNKKASGIFSLLVVPLPLVGFCVYSMVTGDMEFPDAVRTGLIVSLIFLAFMLFSMFKSRKSAGYDGVVVDKQSRDRKEAKGDDTNWYTEYITYVRTDNGQSKKIVETSRGMTPAWEYLNIGDRFRYHPQFAFPYERYEKTEVSGIYCVICGSWNSVELDRCAKCGVPLLK